jgi:hypothetical protein
MGYSHGIQTQQIPFEKSKASEENKQVLFSKCININKEIARHVKKRITKLGINQKYIYPDAWKIAHQTFAKTK